VPPLRYADLQRLIPDLPAPTGMDGRHDAAGLDFVGVSADSRRMQPGFLFAALPGTRVDGRRFIAEAVARGAVAVLAPEGTAWPDGVPPRPLLSDREPRRRLAQIAAALAGAQPAVVVAVTGTNGKTSTVEFLRQVWTAAGHPAASLGTLGLHAPGFEPGPGLTTPDPQALADMLARLARAGTAVTHCACSNQILASGHCPVCDMERAGVNVGLGVDGSASNNGSNMMQEVRAAYLLQRGRYGVGRVSHLDALRWGTIGSAACIGRPELGRIAVGAAADFALFRLDELRFSGALDPVAALVVCGAHRADRVMVAGRWVVEDGCIPGLDLPGLLRRHDGAARVLAAG